MVRKFVLMVACFGILSCLQAQEKKTPILVQKNKFGYDFVREKCIEGEKYFFNKRIYGAKMDTIERTMILQLRDTSVNGRWYKNSGSILVYNFKNAGLSWEKSVNYASTNILDAGRTLLFTSPKGSCAYDMLSGEELWKSKLMICYVDEARTTGLGVKANSSKGWQKYLYGIDMFTGTDRWKREMPFDYGWDGVVEVNDTTLLVVAGGLHTVNLLDGSGWDYAMKTAVKDYSRTVAQNVVGITMGILTGTGMISYGYDLLCDLTSNVLMDQTGYYFASKDEIVHVDMEGRELWKTPLPKDMSAKSMIFMEGGLLYMVNFATAFFGSKATAYGTSFFACFDPMTGNQKMFNIFEDRVLECVVDQGNAVLVFPNKLMRYQLEGGELASAREFLPEQHGKLVSIQGPRLFYARDSVFESVATMRPDCMFVYADSNVVLAVDKDLEVKYSWKIDDLYMHYVTYQGYRFLGKDGMTIVIDASGKKVAELQVASDSAILGDKLYGMSKNYFVEVCLDFLHP